MNRVQIYWSLVPPQVDTVSNTYGIHSASDVFQWEVTSIISHIRGSANSQDTFVLWEKTVQEHDECLKDKRKWFETK